MEEDRRNKLPANYEARKRRQEWILNEEKRKDEAEARVNITCHAISKNIPRDQTTLHLINTKIYFFSFYW